MAYTRNWTDSSRPLYQWFQQGTSAPIVSYANVVLNQSRTGEKMPDWREKIRAGANATTPFSTDRLKYLKQTPGPASSFVAGLPGNPTAKLAQTWYGFAKPLASTLPHLTGSTASAEAMALSQLYRKIDSELSQINSLASLAEFGDVLHQFGHPFQAIIDLTNRRLNRLQLESRGLKGSIAFRKIRFAEIVASTWLEYAFGLAPLISDTRKVAESVARWQYESSGEAPRRERVTGSGLTTLDRVQTGTVSSNNGRFVFSTVDRVKTEFRCRYTCGLDASIHADFGSNARLLELLGFDPIKFIPAAWEVVPWSWLIDYFTNVGDILQASVTSTAGVTWISKTVSTRSVQDVQSHFLEANTRQLIAATGYSNIEQLKGSEGGSFKLVRTTVNRTVPATLGVPPLSFTLPSQLGQLANLAAVLISRRPQSSSLWLY